MIRLATPCIWTIVCTKGKKESIFTVWFACFLNDICIMSGLSVSISACFFFFRELLFLPDELYDCRPLCVKCLALEALCSKC